MPIRRRTRRAAAIVLALIVPLTDLVSPYAEANVWAERRAARSTGSTFQVAGLPAAGPLVSFRDRLPTAHQQAAGGGSASEGLSDVPALLHSIGRDLALIRVAKPRTQTGAVVFHVHDVHGNPEAQKRLASA